MWKKPTRGTPTPQQADSRTDARDEDALAGRVLIGEDFTAAEVEDWFESEREGYANLTSTTERDVHSHYEYHALNLEHGFSKITRAPIPNALGLGSAYGAEFLPIIDRIRDLTIVEPSDQLVSSRIGSVVPRYVKPEANGVLPFPDEAFDLAVCLGTLHHIPKVSFAISELARTLAPGGYALIREPIVSMGDWRTDRGPGVTPRERGIPLHLLREFVIASGLTIQHETMTGFRPLIIAAHRMGFDPYNSRVWTRADAQMARAFARWYSYHATTRRGRLRPTAAFIVATKRSAS